MASPALSASRATGFDFRRANEYPILLGDSLRNNSDAARDQLVNLRYNWQPSTGLRDMPGTLKKTSVGYSLALGNDASDTSTYYYKGHVRPEAGDTGSYALVFNKQKSAFLLEKVTKSIDMNVEEGPSIRYEAAKDLRQLPKPSKYVKPIANGDTNCTTDNEEPDHSNPFDFRHFLAQAKETAEKPGLPTGNNTPRVGGGTPVPGFPSPLAGPSRFGSTTPLMKPVPSTSGPQKKRRVDEKKAKASPPLRQRPAKKAESKAKDRISDSDDETIVAAKLADWDGASNVSPSDNLSQSQHIVVNDGGLEIDIGSPPREDRERKRGRLDLSAFRGPMDQAISRSRNRAPREQSERKNTDSEQEEDADIEELELGSPRSPQISTSGSRSAPVFEPVPPTSYPKPDHAPTPTDQPVDDDYDDLAAEFEAALDEADEDANASHTPYGLGISGAPADNEESEVSEEE
ncbi:hypothetical protein DV735_g5158, partial [Chaetothyriales sp. CBS 134920]